MRRRVSPQAGQRLPPGTLLKSLRLSMYQGSGADAGVLNMNGAQLAIDNINEAGGIQSLGGKKLELVVGDTMSDTSQAKAVCERVMADHSIVAGIGIGGSSYTIPMMPVFEKDGETLLCRLESPPTLQTRGTPIHSNRCPMESLLEAPRWNFCSIWASLRGLR